MAEIIKRYKKQIGIFLVVGILIIPFLIFVIFKIPAICDFFHPDWDAGDVLGFYGVLLGSFTGVVGVFFSIQYSQENYKADLINRSLPFINITSMRYVPEALNQSVSSKESNAIVYPIETYYYTIQNKSVSIDSRLTEHQEKMVSCGGVYESHPRNGITITQNAKLLYIPLEVENIGNGAATTFSIGLYIPPYSPEKHPKAFSLARSLRVGEKIQVVIYSENDDQDNVGDYEMCVSYYDILGNAYEQLYSYRIFLDGHGELRASLQMNGTQKRL